MMGKSNISICFCLSFIIGIFLGSVFQISSLIQLGFLILGIIFISVLWRYKKVAVLGFCFVFLAFGIVRFQKAEISSQTAAAFGSENQGQEISLIGVVSDEPETKEKSASLKIRTGQGNILASVFKYPQYEYGDKIKITGKLEIPSSDIDGFNYRNYLKKDGIFATIRWPKVEMVERETGNPLKSLVFSFKKRFQGLAENFIVPPQEGILEALFSGDESHIPQDLKDKLNITGTRHIAAVSGMNISIIASMIFAFALGLGLWRKQSFYISLMLIFLYIIMIGAPASGVRAGIMAALFMAAQYCGRISAASRLVVFAAFSMLLINPFLLTADIGFQLSFLAILGIVYFQPFFANLLKFLPNPNLFPLKTVLATTLSAQTLTLPILIYNFGRISLISPITNILIVPFLAPVTILIFAFGIGGMIFKLFGSILMWPTWLSLTYILKIVEWFSKIPFASISVSGLHWIWLVIAYILLAFSAWRLNKREKLKFLDY